MALNTAWIETLRVGINERCSCLDLNPLSIGMNPAFNLTENAGTGVLLKTAIPQGIEASIKALAPYFYNQNIWDIDDPDTWVLWTAKELWNAAYQGYYVPHEQTAVLSDIQLDVNWYNTMRNALNLLQYTPYTSQRKGLGQTGSGGDEQTHTSEIGLPANERLPMAPTTNWTGAIGSQTENDTVNVTVWGAKYSHAVTDATGYGLSQGLEIGPYLNPAEYLIYNYSYWSFLWMAGKNLAEYKETAIPAKPISSTIRRYHKKVKEGGYSPFAVGWSLQAYVETDVEIEEGWDNQEDQTIDADTEETYEEVIDTELNELNPQEPAELSTDIQMHGGGDGFWQCEFNQYLCMYDTSASVKSYPSISFPAFASYRKYNFTEL